MFDPGDIQHPNSTEWLPSDHVADYVTARLRTPLDKQVRAKLKSECSRPALSSKIAVTPAIDSSLLTFFTKYGKDPRKGVDKAWSTCQDKLLDIVGPLTRIFDIAESARLDKVAIDPEELSLWAQRAAEKAIKMKKMSKKRGRKVGKKRNRRITKKMARKVKFEETEYEETPEDCEPVHIKENFKNRRADGLAFTQRAPGKIFSDALSDQDHIHNNISKALSQVQGLAAFFNAVGQHHFSHLLTVSQARIPATLLYAIECIDIANWDILDKIEGRILRRLAPCNNLASVAAQRLEFGIKNTFVQGLVTVIQRVHCLAHSEESTLRNLDFKEIFSSLRGKFWFFRNYTLAVQLLELDPDLITSIPLIILKKTLKEVTWSKGFIMDHESCLSKRGLAKLIKSVTSKVDQS
ncbi:hypothetical protein NDU88_008358 [Pleurodeles waltl]|uniref:Uncharacterized protein n=1 Tax=Pleurodeles waltl TaxID=8319 RepID=A0AAV7P033_PLEWA|nr:hypothetical protein NDU88_008358 [Pleurodeles waltl]